MPSVFSIGGFGELGELNYFWLDSILGAGSQKSLNPAYWWWANSIFFCEFDRSAMRYLINGHSHRDSRQKVALVDFGEGRKSSDPLNLFWLPNCSVPSFFGGLDSMHKNISTLHNVSQLNFWNAWLHCLAHSVQFNQYRSTQPGIPLWVGAMSTNQRAVMLCGWGVKAGMVRVWVTGKTVLSPS